MSKELRVLAIVLGLVGTIVAFTVFAKHLASQSRDPLALMRTAHKIATFDIPRGYAVTNATDLGITLSVTLRPADRRSAFQISLDGSRFPTNADSQGSGEVVGMTIAERLLGCTPGPATTIAVTVRGAAHDMHVVRCIAKDGRAMRAEFVSFAGNVASVNLSAIGAGGEFDDAAVRELLASVR